MKIDNHEKTLLSNTVFLYAMQFSTHLFGLLTVPYLTRVLGPEVYGKVGVALAYMTYVAVILDFGFLLSATRKIAENRNDIHKLSEIVSAVTLIKLVLCLIAASVFILIVTHNGAMKNDMAFYLLYLAAYVVQSLFPDYLYRGIENMKAIALRALAAKALSAVLTVALVKTTDDYVLIPLFLLIGNLMSLLFIIFDVRKKAVRLVTVGRGTVVGVIRDTIPFFVSRISSTAYHALGTIIIGSIYGNAAVVGHYASADKLVSLARAGASPIADSMYPYMIRNKDYRLVKRLLFAVMPLITIGAALLWIFAEPICGLLFGAEYTDAGKILRCLLPVMWVILPSCVLAFPVLVPMGLTKHANLSNVIGMILQLALLGFLFFSGSLTVYSICVVMSVTECAVFLYRLSAAIFSRKRMIPEAR